MSRNTMSCLRMLGALILLSCCMSTEAVTLNFCEGETATLDCGSYVIYIEDANYGRTDTGTCSACRPTSEISNTNCINPQTLLMSNTCNGQTSCSMAAVNSVFTDPCPGTYKYLRVTYTCYPLNTATICQGKKGTLDCGSSMIYVVSANFGRTDSVTCISGSPASQITSNCINPSTSWVSTLCNGHNSCNLHAVSPPLTDTCPPGIRKYLAVSYICFVG